jgi:hypothetical protein
MLAEALRICDWLCEVESERDRELAAAIKSVVLRVQRINERKDRLTKRRVKKLKALIDDLVRKAVAEASNEDNEVN